MNHPQPTIPDSVKEVLDAQKSPRVRVIWEPTKPRWEVWIELIDNSHPNNRFYKSLKGRRRDRYIDGTWWRFLQTWCFKHPRTKKDIGFCPLDNRFLRALHEVDTFKNRLFYEEEIEAREQEKEQKSRKERLETFSGVEEYYSDWDNPIISPGATGTKADWRHRIR